MLGSSVRPTFPRKQNTHGRVRFLKRCSRCKIEKNEDDFHADSSRNDGLCRYCKECKRKIDSKTYRKNPQAKIAISSANARKSGRIFVSKPYNPSYYSSDSSRKKKRSRDLNRRALKRSAEGKITKDVINEVLMKYDGRCAYCGIECAGSYTIDHKIPLSRGGCNKIDNLALACRKCNCKKNDKTDYEYCGRSV